MIGNTEKGCFWTVYEYALILTLLGFDKDFSISNNKE